MCYGEGQDFVYFRLFSQYNNKYNTKFDYKWKQDRRRAWDSNPAPQNGRLRQIHWAMGALLRTISFKLGKYETSLPTTKEFYIKWAIPGLFFIFVLFNDKFYRKTVGFSEIQTKNTEVEGEQDNHLTTWPPPTFH